MKGRVFVVGVGMTKFVKPGTSGDYPDMAKEAINKALADCGLPYNAVQQACVGYVYGDSCCGQRALYEVGITGIPIYNANNNCATGSTALYMAKQFVEGGISDCVLALGFEKMERGSLSTKFNDRSNPLEMHVSLMAEVRGFSKAPPAPQMFGNAGREHMEKYGTKLEHFAKIAEKNHRHSANNPYSQFRDIYTLKQIMESPKVHEPLTKLQCCPTSDGAAAAVLCSERFVYKYGLQKTAVEIIGMKMATDTNTTFDEKSMMKMVGYDMTKNAAEEVYRQSGYGPKDVQVIELHDCFSANELITYEALGLCKPGDAGKLIEKGDVTYGGRWVVNPSGGLISKGHPLGATGLAQCSELCWQLRGQADKRQVKGAKIALQHNLGLGGAVVITMYKRPNFGPQTHTPKTWESIGGAPKKIEAAAAAAPAPKAAKAAPKAAGNAGGAAAAAAKGFKATAVFDAMKKQLASDPSLVKKVKCIYRFDITAANNSKASWLVDLKNGSGSVQQDNGSSKADAIIAITDNDFVALMQGKLNPQSAFMSGKLKVKGNIMLAQKLGMLMDKKAKL